MVNDNWLEIPVFIHGLTEEREPDSHYKSFLTLLNNVNKYLRQEKKPPFSEPPITVEWGFDLSPSKDKYLARVEALVADRVSDAIKKASDFTVNPMRNVASIIREKFLFALPDAFFYISDEGEKIIRRNIFNKLADETLSRAGGNNNPNKKISLTIFGHSMGSIIAHDFLFHLFREKEIRGWENKVKILRRDLVQTQAARDGSVGESRLRVRRLFTFGSPISLSIFRTQKLIDIINSNQKIGVKELGFQPDQELGFPRWVNYWDKDDVISYPLAFLYETFGETKVVEDKNVDVSDLVSSAHGKYFESEEMAKDMASVW